MTQWLKNSSWDNQKYIMKHVSLFIYHYLSYELGISYIFNLRGGTRKVGKQERNRRKNEGERGGKNT